MRVFIAGATGAVGVRLVPLLVAAGHHVVGLTRSADKADSIRRMGADAVVADGLDALAVRSAVANARPEVIVHEMTALRGGDLRRFDRTFALSNRLRTEGLDHLLAAGREVGAKRFVAQSYCGWPYARSGDPVKTEDDPLDPDPPAQFRETLNAIRHLETRLLGATDMTAVVLRYGAFYGPKTGTTEDSVLEQLRRRIFPMIGPGTGWWSFLHIDDAAIATAVVVEGGPGGIYNIVDDDPAPVSHWLPALAAAAGARAPHRIPRWLGRWLAGEHLAIMMNDVRAGSNAKARRDLGWTPLYGSWRTGFQSAIAVTE